MDEYQIITDFGCDLPLHIAEEQNIEVIPMEVFIESEEPKRGSEVDVYEFYQKLREKKEREAASDNSMPTNSLRLLRHIWKREKTSFMSHSPPVSAVLSAPQTSPRASFAKNFRRGIFILSIPAAAPSARDSSPILPH